MGTPAYCTNCGSALRETAKFCPKCGTTVQAIDEPAGAPAEPVAPPPAESPPHPATVAAEYVPLEPQDYPPARPPAPPEPPAKPVYKQPLIWVVGILAVVCLCCMVAGLYAVQRTADMLNFNDEIETLGSVVPGIEDIATQIPEIEELATQIPEIENLATEMPELEQLATDGLPDLEQLATDLPLPDLDIELPTD